MRAQMCAPLARTLRREQACNLYRRYGEKRVSQGEEGETRGGGFYRLRRRMRT